MVNGCDQWVWSMAVSIGGGFTGKPHHDVSLFLLSVSFFAASIIPTSFFFFVKKIFHSCSGTFCNLCNTFFAQYKHIWATTGVPRQPYEGLHIIMFYTRRSKHTHERFISCDGHQLYAYKGRDVNLEVEGVRYIEMHRGPHTC